MPPLPSTRTTRLVEVQVLEVDANQLAQAQPRRVEQLEHRAIAASERQRVSMLSSSTATSVPTSAPGIVLSQLRRDRGRRRIVLDHSFAPQVVHERAGPDSFRATLGRACPRG